MNAGFGHHSRIQLRGRNLALLVERLSPLRDAKHPIAEVVLVNDGSRDRSGEVIEQLAARYPWVHGIWLMRNYGQHNALLAGIRAARYDTIVTMDDDLQNPPEEIPRLLQKLEEGYDVAYGTPQSPQHGFLRNIASRITKIVLQDAMGAETARNVSAFRAFSDPLAERHGGLSGSVRFHRAMLLTWGAARFAAVGVKHNPREIGKSNYTVGKLIAHAVNMMTGFSALPLQIASLLGFAFTLFGMCVLAFVLARYVIYGGGVPGFPFLAAVIAIFSGAQLFALGVIGEYLARVHFRLTDRPTYTIASTTSDKNRYDACLYANSLNGIPISSGSASRAYPVTASRVTNSPAPNHGAAQT